MEEHTNVFAISIEKETLENTYYREVLFTTDRMQLVLMSLQPAEDINFEIHQVDQFIRIESGEATILIGSQKELEYELKDGDIIIIPANTYHQVINRSKTNFLKLYTIYTPPNHPFDKLDREKPKDD